MQEKASKTISSSIKQTRLYHRRYLIAINNPVRREILRLLRKGSLNVEQLREATRQNKGSLEWHLSILEHGLCVEKDHVQGKPTYTLTQEGRVVDYLG